MSAYIAAAAAAIITAAAYIEHGVNIVMHK